MFRSLGVTVAVVAASSAMAAEPAWVSSTPAGGYVPGSIVAGYDTPAAAFGKPDRMVGLGSGYESMLSPFSPHYETDHLVAIGRGGSITLQFEKPVAGASQVGVFTSAGLMDVGFGQAGNPAMNFASAEYGVQRTAHVELAGADGIFTAVGRFTFEQPSNYYANITSPYPFPSPNPAVLADFGKPFTGALADFDGKDLPGILAVLDGSAGGTWLNVPAGLAEVSFIRLSDPKWITPTGQLLDVATSTWDGATKGADLYIDGVAAVVPEPSGMIVLAAAIAGMSLRRRRA